MWLLSSFAHHLSSIKVEFYSCYHYFLCQVGYILGLGDRHPSNLMLDRYRYIEINKGLTLLKRFSFSSVSLSMVSILQWENLAY